LTVDIAGQGVSLISDDGTDAHVSVNVSSERTISLSKSSSSPVSSCNHHVISKTVPVRSSSTQVEVMTSPLREK